MQTRWPNGDAQRSFLVDMLAVNHLNFNPPILWVVGGEGGIETPSGCRPSAGGEVAYPYIPELKVDVGGERFKGTVVSERFFVDDVFLRPLA